MYIIHKNLTSKVINVDKFCIEKVMEVHAIILQLTYLNTWILSISTAPLVILNYLQMNEIPYLNHSTKPIRTSLFVVICI